MNPQDQAVQMNELVDRFLGWPLPSSVCSDICATIPNYSHRVGTNLLTADEAKQMLEHVVGGMLEKHAQLSKDYEGLMGALQTIRAKYTHVTNDHHAVYEIADKAISQAQVTSRCQHGPQQLCAVCYLNNVSPQGAGEKNWIVDDLRALREKDEKQGEKEGV